MQKKKNILTYKTKKVFIIQVSKKIIIIIKNNIHSSNSFRCIYTYVHNYKVNII